MDFEDAIHEIHVSNKFTTTDDGFRYSGELTERENDAVDELICVGYVIKPV